MKNLQMISITFILILNIGLIQNSFAIKFFDKAKEGIDAASDSAMDSANAVKNKAQQAQNKIESLKGKNGKFSKLKVAREVIKGTGFTIGMISDATGMIMNPEETGEDLLRKLKPNNTEMKIKFVSKARKVNVLDRIVNKFKLFESLPVGLDTINPTTTMQAQTGTSLTNGDTIPSNIVSSEIKLEKFVKFEPINSFYLTFIIIEDDKEIEQVVRLEFPKLKYLELFEKVAKRLSKNKQGITILEGGTHILIGETIIETKILSELLMKKIPKNNLDKRSKELVVELNEQLDSLKQPEQDATPFTTSTGKTSTKIQFVEQGILEILTSENEIETLTFENHQQARLFKSIFDIQRANGEKLTITNENSIFSEGTGMTISLAEITKTLKSNKKILSKNKNPLTDNNLKRPITEIANKLLGGANNKCNPLPKF